MPLSRSRARGSSGTRNTWFWEHLASWEETYQVLFQENRILKQTGQPPDEEFLRPKKALLQRFDSSHRALAEADRTAARHHRPSIQKTQQVVLKTLLLDLENEQLLLKCALGGRPRLAPPDRFSSLGAQGLRGSDEALLAAPL